MNLAELQSEMVRLSKLLDEALAYLRSQVQEYAKAEDAYRMVRAKAFLESEGSVAAREAHVDSVTSDERQRAHIAEGMKQAALEAVRSRRSQLSAFQTMAAAFREEAHFARVGPDSYNESEGARRFEGRIPAPASIGERA